MGVENGDLNQTPPWLGIDFFRNNTCEITEIRSQNIFLSLLEMDQEARE